MLSDATHWAFNCSNAFKKKHIKMLFMPVSLSTGLLMESFLTATTAHTMAVAP